MMLVGRVVVIAVVVMAAAACYGSDEGSKRPLSEGAPGSRVDPASLPPGHPPIAGQEVTPGRTAITGKARVALDSGNALYKAKSYPNALAQYRRAATLAPREEAPLVGMMMVANVTNNPKLADSVATRLRSLQGSLTAGRDSLSASELKDIHAGVRPPATPVPPAKKL
jgi:hypothetical protein